MVNSFGACGIEKERCKGKIFFCLESVPPLIYLFLLSFSESAVDKPH